MTNKKNTINRFTFFGSGLVWWTVTMMFALNWILHKCIVDGLALYDCSPYFPLFTQFTVVVPFEYAQWLNRNDTVHPKYCVVTGMNLPFIHTYTKMKWSPNSISSNELSWVNWDEYETVIRNGAWSENVKIKACLQTFAYQTLHFRTVTGTMRSCHMTLVCTATVIEHLDVCNILNLQFNFKPFTQSSWIRIFECNLVVV